MGGVPGHVALGQRTGVRGACGSRVDRRSRGQETYISPWENGCAESFNARLRDELLDHKIVIESWRRHCSGHMPRWVIFRHAPASCPRSPEGRCATSIGCPGQASVAHRPSLKLTSNPAQWGRSGSARPVARGTERARRTSRFSSARNRKGEQT